MKSTTDSNINTSTDSNINTSTDPSQTEILWSREDNSHQDDDKLSSDRIVSVTPSSSDDDDDANLSDDDLGGRDLDIENSDEWDEANMEDELDDRDLEDDDQANADLHNVKNDHFGSITSELAGDDPGETPEEQQTHNTEYGAPSEKELGVGTHPDEEVTYTETTEVKTPQTTEKQQTHTATLNSLDASFVGNNHGRTSGRMIDHEPGLPNNL